MSYQSALNQTLSQQVSEVSKPLGQVVWLAHCSVLRVAWSCRAPGEASEGIVFEAQSTLC